MNSPGQRGAWIAAVAATALTAVGLWVEVGAGSGRAGSILSQLGVSVGLAVSLPVLGAFILNRDATNRLGWVFIATGLSRAVYVLATSWVEQAYVVRPGSIPGGSWATWAAVSAVFPAVILSPLVLLWAPNGRLPGRGWRWVYSRSA